ncbi:hypothetical protein [Pasteurella testudinis]|uniref:hypothetical protein n=1 Tax=Pasteurella testudinis TaxID=761 RepID=UPI0040588F01
MWKRRVLYLLITGSAALVLLTVYQLQRLEDRLQDLLQQQLPDLHFDTHSFSYLPTPTISLSQATYQYQHWALSAQQVKTAFSWGSLLGLSPRITQAELVGGVLTAQQQPELENIAVKLENIDRHYNSAQLTMSADTPSSRLNVTALAQRFANGIELNRLQLNAVMTQGYFLNNPNLALQADKLSLSLQQNMWQLALQQGKLNQLALTRAVLHYYPAEGDAKPHFDLQLQPPQGKLRISSRQQAQGNLLNLQGEQLALAPLLEFLRLPILLEGVSHFSGDTLFDNGVLARGDLTLNVGHTKLNGLNLLDLVSQYFPIRQGAKKYSDRIETPFEQVDIALDWNREKVNFKRISAQGNELNLSGKGEMDLTDFSCRVELKLSPNIAGYSQYQLPVSLFGPCRSPQYRVSLDKKLGDQLKQILKDKLKERH